MINECGEMVVKDRRAGETMREVETLRRTRMQSGRPVGRPLWSGRHPGSECRIDALARQEHFDLLADAAHVALKARYGQGDQTTDARSQDNPVDRHGAGFVVPDILEPVNHVSLHKLHLAS
jgi:hypothetical protein